jgi:muramoyltetrapeptide carboxypeptidase
VVAPAGPFDRDELFRGLAWLRMRYRLRVSSGVLCRTGFTAGTDARRAAELRAAMLAPEVSAVVCARGGYGALRILDDLPWGAFAAKPKWLVGFSDVTALHARANGLGICSVHAPNVTGLGRAITADERHALLAALEGLPAEPWRDLSVIHPGPAVSGPLVGGNLALLEAMAGARRLALPPGAVLAIEDVTERPYRLDRMLTTLRLGGFLDGLAAVVLGGFTQCEPGPDGVTAAEVLAERTATLGVPVVGGAPFGHGAPNRAFVLGRPVRLDGSTLTFAR